MSIECYDSKCHLHDPSTPYCTQDTCVMVCPKCGSKDFIPENILLDAYLLDSGVVIFKCECCQAKLESSIKRHVITQVLSVKCI